MSFAVVLVTDAGRPFDATLQVVREAAVVLGGRLAVQLRDKVAPDATFLAHALALREVTRATGARLFLNGRHALAVRVGADGVHVPSGGTVAAVRAVVGDLPVSVATHDDDDVERAIRDGADAVLVSPIFATPGKGRPRGLDAIASARRHVVASGTNVRVVALGGVDAGNAASCRDAGADAVAVIRALYDASDVAHAAHVLAFGVASPSGEW